MRYVLIALGVYLVLSGDLSMGNGKVKDMIEQLCKSGSDGRRPQGSWFDSTG